MTIPSDRLKALHELAADTRRLRSRLFYLRLIELRGWTMTPAERAERLELERETERDRQDERQGDWTR
jgi:hypothetical protein